MGRSVWLFSKFIGDFDLFSFLLILNSLISENYNLKAIEIENGWLELDSLSDLKTYEKLYENNILKRFFDPTK